MEDLLVAGPALVQTLLILAHQWIVVSQYAADESACKPEDRQVRW
ncbi:hypothetical protein OAF34_05855 [Pirellulaceae bacterium]|jgi:hypothetical protein|nr:hypothetical protein [Pirellulaceae bacterium]